MPAAIPLIATGISVVGGAIGKKKDSNRQQAQQAQTQVPLAGMQQAGQTAFGQGQQLYGFGMPRLNQAASYYSTLLNGNRAAMTQAIQPEIAGITDTYRGAERSLERSGVRGAQRDVAQAELARSRAGQIGGLLGGVRPMAAQALGQLGQFGVSQGQQGIGSAGTIYGNMLSGLTGQRQIGLEERKYGDEQSGALWGNIGKLITDGYGAWKNRGQ